MMQEQTWAVCSRGVHYDAGVDMYSLWKRWCLWSLYGQSVLKMSLLMQKLT